MKLRMKSYWNSLKNQDGFTLVELMVVVAIIGLLSAVAIPNFKKYQAKSKMSEAKLQLSALYTAETSFFADFNMYHNCLPYMGFDPGPEAFNRYYAIGITQAAAAIDAAAYSAAVNSGLNSGQCGRTNAALAGGLGTTSANSATWFPAGKGIGASIANVVGYVPAAETNLGTQATIGAMVFTAGAGGVISVDNNYGASGTSSYLTIDEKKVFRTVRNGF